MRLRVAMALLAATLLIAPAFAVDLTPIRYLVLTTDGGEPVGELLTADRFETGDEPGVVFGLLETAQGERSAKTLTILLATTFRLLGDDWPANPTLTIEGSKPDERAHDLARALEGAAQNG